MIIILKKKKDEFVFLSFLFLLCTGSFRYISMLVASDHHIEEKGNRVIYISVHIIPVKWLI